MSDLQTFAPAAHQVAEVVDYMMVDELQLMPPEFYEVNEREGRVYVTAIFNPLALGRNLKAYENPDIARRLKFALGGLPVAITKKTGTHYVILLSGKLSLPKSILFPGFGEPDIFRLGVGLRGPINLHANQVKNALIGAAQGVGKSNVESLLVHQARQFGWKLYLADPDGHTFNPDVWNSIAAAPVASSPTDLLMVLERVAAELADRVVLFRNVAAVNGGIPPADLDACNLLTTEPLPRIALSIDEANSYLSDKKIFGLLADLLRRGRKWGLHIFLSGHEWHKDTVLAEVNDMLQTRIGLSVTTEQMGAVILRSNLWGRRVMGKPPGRGVLRTNQYQLMQFYQVTEEMEREWLKQPVSAAAQLPEDKALLVKRSLEEADGKMTVELLELWGVGHRDARRLVEEWELKGWLRQDATRGNARYITPILADLLPNRQTRQTLPNAQIWSQTDAKPRQTPNMGAAA